MAKLTDYLKLMRITLLPTAWSNVLAGVALSTMIHQSGFSGPGIWASIVEVLVCSSCLYLGGMVFNDVFDVELDRIERPERVLPSGKIAVSNAKRLGIILFMVAFLAAVSQPLSRLINGGEHGVPLPMVATVCGLVGLILFYNGIAKHYWFGSWMMGSCRMFNVLLGVLVGTGSSADMDVFPAAWFAAGGMGLYVAGITMFARHENQAGHSRSLWFGGLTMAGAVAIIFMVPFLSLPPINLSSTGQSSVLTMGLLAIVLVPVTRNITVAVITRQPHSIKRGVITSLLTIIMIDASICYVALPRFPAFALAVASLIIPAFLMSRRIMAT